MSDTSEGERATAEDDTRTVVTDGAETPSVRSIESSRPRRGLDEDPEDGPRYVIVHAIGHGGMGTVLRAYDARLHREVALKRLRSDVLDDAAEARLVREAQAMAQLSHPNVVAVYDVERSERGVELAMELVPGTTLQAWLKADERSAAEIVRAFRQAGEGLAAAHRAGLVHRDFKPANVLVGDDGQVKVTDFGLAKAATVPASEETVSVDGAPVVEELDSLDSLRSPLTRADTVVGTPRYMAPEQYVGAKLDARTDQYAYCVALWEALVGEPPFRGDFKTIGVAKAKGPPPWPRPTKVPRRLPEAIRRGLSPDPEDRWPTMDALLATMGDGPRHVARQLAVMVGVASIAALVTWGMQPSTPEDTRCQGAEAELVGVWDDERRRAVEASLTAAGAEAVPEVVDALDQYAEGWVAQHTDACEASSVRGEQSPAVMDLRMACLRRARMQLLASAELLASADAQVAEKALDVARGMPRVSGCEDIDRLRARSPGPDDPEVAEQVDAIRQELARVLALERAGKWDDALTLARSQEDAVAATGFAPIQALSRFGVGHLLERQGKYEESIAAMREALSLALAANELDLAAKSAGILTFLLSDAVGRPDEAQWVATIALGLANRDEANKVAQGVSHGNFATVLYHQGKYQESVVHRREALAAFEATDMHHEIALAHANLAGTLAAMGELDEAEAEFERARQTYASSVGLDHPDVAHVHAGLGSLLVARERPDEAIEQLRRATELFEKGQGPDSPQAAAMRAGIGDILREQGKLDEAEQLLRESLERARAAAGGEPNVRVASILGQLGRLLTEQDRHEQAEAILSEALAMHEETGGAEQDDTARLNVWMSQSLAARGEHGAALERLERAWAIGEHVDLPPPDRAGIAFALARALWKDGRDRERARALAKQALDGLPEGDLRSEITAWIAEPSAD